MKKSDIFAMALKNLKGRRSRTKLTIIGVVIGTCAIVIMISIGAGINNMLTQEYKSSSTATRISIYANTDSNADEADKMPLNDSAVSYFKSMDHVETVLPVINMSDYVSITRGKYTYNGDSVMAVDFDTLEKLGVQVENGTLKRQSDPYTVYVGSTAVTNFADKQGNSVECEYDDNFNLVSCEIDPLKDTFYLAPAVLDAENQTASSAATHKLRVAGVLSGSGSSGLDSIGSIFIDIRAAEKIIREYNAINNKPNKPVEYSEVFVYTDKIDNVKSVQSNLNAAGLSTYSNQDDQEYIKKIMTVVQVVLGAIGAVSMFVAAFGISNTMIMAVYERTKEIGVMKVIGCDISDIKTVFLCEAGLIGFIGGVIGVFISIIVSLIANAVAGAVLSSTLNDMSIRVTVSSVPLWLVVLGIGFSVLVGVISGVSPANRAVKVSALKAIHNE